MGVFYFTFKKLIMSKKQTDYLIIDRSKWRTGGDIGTNNETGKGATALLNKQGFMCCLGFRCNQMGIPKRLLLNMGTPEDIQDWNIPDLVDEEDGKDTTFVRDAVEINDDYSLTSKEREKKIIEHFATKDIKVEFVGSYVK
jgi:hypothetical protein